MDIPMFLKIKLTSLAAAVLFLGILFQIETSLAEELKKDEVKDRYGLAMALGKSYDPTNHIDFYLLSGVALYDYEKIWRHRAPEPLRFKVEYSIGTAREKKSYLMTSMNMFALYYLDLSGYDDFTPYVEAGIGVIYTGFQVKGQGLKVNFNPQMGIGAEFKTESRDIYFLSLRLHHLSNAHMADENRGVNSVVLMFGRFF
jgi:lipid A 3-O-deacylase